MGTPLKSLPVLLSPRLLSPLSPLSPRLLSVPGEKTFSSLHKRPVEGVQRALHAAKKLEFSQYASPKHFLEPVRVKVTDYTAKEKEIHKSDIVINTPTKRDIFENGIGQDKGHIVLGTGSFGKVVRGIFKGKIVAVKVVKNTMSPGEKNALSINHENIVKTLDIIQNREGNYSMIIMEYFSNSKQLQTLLENDYEHKIDVTSYALDISTGLDFIHAHGILHLDIKPQNILVTGNTCKICDFGNSISLSEIENFNHQGTIVYTAPELLQGQNPTEKCDIYSLGILLWQMKSKTVPYNDMDNVETVIYKVVKCNYRPENVISKDEYSQLYQACWDVDQNERPLIANIISRLRKMY